MSHSKRNTSRAVFTSHERDLARKAWVSTSARLTRESFLSFASCRLCLQPAIDPVSCSHGDLFCRECALSNILAQKKEIKRLEKAKEQEDRDAAERATEQDAAAHEREVREFELTQNGLDMRASASSSSQQSKTLENTPNPPQSTSQTPISGNGDGGGGGGSGNETRKRKFEIDEVELAHIATTDRAKARKALDDEAAHASRPLLPSFWVPSVTPTSNTSDALHSIAKKLKTQPICPASAANKPHPYSLHGLVSVKFAEEDQAESTSSSSSSGGMNKKKICPSCKKVLNNASKAVLAKPCGHVLCGSCVDKFMWPGSHNKHHDPHAATSEVDDLRCYVCEADLTDRGDKNHREQAGKKKKDKDSKDRVRPGLVELRSEGTGFSSAGANQVQKDGVGAFQC
ncbi:ENOS interacting protein [Xylariaceae sp. FL0255]|nr:ENOS interacting protein [Xylariaceae sp. FL0255]